ncbi:hypothetical protein [Ornithinimicrobium avium]|uniref:DUF1453 domain-containing protein n=1 Tax=Ornithinimicrobium avium TaxID=2283195 RepID=A0A345NKC2_9MICO|nr:hypothetical protein [Ornithinimicrobium avium]AXH95480.1 hypothetical protein DV701_04455 [Ornithinimicrobium avium]
MSTAQWILNASLLAWVLTRNLGTRRVNALTFLVPLMVVSVAGGWFLRDVPTAGHDTTLELIGLGVGVLLGAAAAALTEVSSRDGGLLVRAGVGFAALWVVVIAGRALFAQWATHGGAGTIGEFSVHHQITGADAWTAAFVIMALAMVSARLVVLLAQVHLHRTVTSTLVEERAA